MKAEPRIRLRWLDMLILRTPRYVVDGMVLHRGTSKRIQLMAVRDARAAILRPGEEQWRLYWAVIATGIFGLPLACVYFVAVAFAIGQVIDLTYDGSTVAAMSLGVVVGLVFGAFITPLMSLIGLIWLWGIRPQLLRAIQAVAEEVCLQCDYDLRGHEATARCPECGAERMRMSEVKA